MVKKKDLKKHYESLKQTSSWQISLLMFKDFLTRGAAWGSLGLTLGIAIGIVFPPAFFIAIASGIGIGIAAGAANVYLNSQYRKIENANISKIKGLEAEQKNLDDVDIASLDEHQQQEIEHLIAKIKNMSAEQRKAYAAALPWGHSLKETIPVGDPVSDDAIVIMRKAIEYTLRQVVAATQPSVVEQKLAEKVKAKKGVSAKIRGLFTSADTTVAGFGIMTSSMTIISFILGGVAAVPAVIGVLGAWGISLALGIVTGGVQHALTKKGEAQKERITQLKQQILSKHLAIASALNALIADAKSVSHDWNAFYEAADTLNQEEVSILAQQRADISSSAANPLTMDSKQAQLINNLKKPSNWRTFLPLWFKDFARRTMGLGAIGVTIGVAVGIIFPPLLILSVSIGVGAGIVVGAITAYASNYRNLESKKIKKMEQLASHWEHPERYSSHKSEMDNLIAQITKKSLHERSYLDKCLPEGHCLKGKIPLSEEVTDNDNKVMHDAVSAFVAQKAAKIAIEPPQKNQSYAAKAAAKGLLSTTELGVSGFKVGSCVISLGGLFLVNPLLAGAVAVGLLTTLVTSLVAGAATAKVQRTYDQKNEERDREINRLCHGVDARKKVVDGALDEIIVDTKVALRQAARMETAFYKNAEMADEKKIFERAIAPKASEPLFQPVPQNKEKRPHSEFNSVLQSDASTRSVKI